MYKGQQQWRRNVLKNRQGRIVNELLIDEGYRALLNRDLGYVLSSQIHGSGRWLDQSGHDSHQCGLTRCSWTNQQVDPAIEGRREVVNDVF